MTNTRIAGALVAYIDCINGAAGDMIVGALLDAGADEQALRSGLESLGLEGYALTINRVKKQGLAATKFDVQLLPEHTQPHRHLKDVVAIIRNGRLSSKVQDLAIRVFEHLAEAEAAVHGTSKEKVHFHEVGAVDAIVDVVSAAICLELLGVGQVFGSAVPVGSGTVKAAHGVLPVPAPATARLLLGVPIAETDEVGELTTPTGAAILRAVATGFGPLPQMTPTAIGYGAGTREGRHRPNVLRIMLGAPVTTGASGLAEGEIHTDHIVQLDTNLDHVSSEIIGYCVERLMDAGALDAFATPIQMKKSRPGSMLTVLAQPERAALMEAIVFAETGTLGVRRRLLTRSTLPRRVDTVETRYGLIRVKVAAFAGRPRPHAEYEDCRAAAIKHEAPIREVQAAAEAAWVKQASDRA